MQNYNLRLIKSTQYNFLNHIYPILKSKYPRFEDIGGLNNAKEMILDTFETPIKFDFLCKNIPFKLPRGILLYGPSGCGKTFLA